MKKSVLFVVIFLTAITSNSFAQRSFGGKPYSFNKHYVQAQTISFVTMPSFNLEQLKSEDAVNDLSKGPFRFGYNHMVNLNLTNSGTWTTLPNGDRIWQLGIKSKGALSLNLAMDDFYIPTNASLFIYTEDKSFVLGAFTSLNNNTNNHFATDLLPGGSIILEYYEPAAVANQGRINIFRVTHGYRGVTDFVEKSFGQSGSCQVNVNCPLGANWQNEKRGVVCLVVGGSEFCSGSLVNDVPEDGKPYVLTANHCSESNDWANWVFRFNWEAPGCTNPGTSPSTAQSLSGSDLKARSGTSDFCLVEITGGLSAGTVPASYATYFNGWSNVNVAATSVVGIHHPNGDIKKISEATNAVTSASYDAGNGAADCWHIGQWTTACTEPGSSGSPLFDQNHHIVGQLYGGPSSCGAAPGSLNDYYGKFATSWLGDGTNSTQLKYWLDPSSTGTTILNGFDPNASPPAYALDAGISSISSPLNGSSTCNSSVVPQVTLRNYGSSTLTSCTINYKLDGGSLQTYNWTGSLATNISTNVTLSTINGLSTASHTLLVYTSSPNGGTEEYPANDSSSSTFSIIAATPLVSALPVTEDFESTFPSTNWTIGNPDANDTWAKTTTAGGFGTSSSSALMNNDATNDITGESDYINSPYIDLSSETAPIKLTFDVAYARYSGTYFDSLIISANTNCGDWQRVYANGGSALATAPDNTSSFVPTNAQWRTDTVDLSSYAGSLTRVRFENKSGWGQNLYIDNINIFHGFTGVENIDFNSAFKVYPNPSAGEINIAINLATAKNVTIKVYDVIGKLITTKNLQNIANIQTTVDFKNQDNGMYFMQITSDKETIVRKINIMK